MNRLLLVLLIIVSSAPSFSASAASGGRTVTLCPKTSVPDCVSPNWGETGPDGVDGAMAPLRGDSIASAIGGGRLAIKLLPVAATPNRTQPAGAPLQTVVSPINLFPKETAALTSAIKQARFNPDGSIASGQERIASAAAAAARAAGKRYTLTLYIKVPQQLAPDESGLLGKKVQSINDVLLPAGGAATGKPES